MFPACPAGTAAPTKSTTSRKESPMSKQNEFIPSDASLMELAVVNWVLHKMKEKILMGVPSGKVIDQALQECLQAGTHLR